MTEGSPARCKEQLRQAPPEIQALAASQLLALAALHYPYLQARARPALLELTAELVDLQAQGAKELCHALLRHCIMYMLLRLLPEVARTPSGDTGQALRDAGSKLAVRLLTEHWDACCGAGRDLFRVLQEASHMAEFHGVWRALVPGGQQVGADANASSNGSALGADSSGAALKRLLATPTPARVLLSRVPPDAESQLLFMLTQVRRGNEKRYQQWFMARHLPRADAEGLVPDLVRYVCAVCHPPAPVRDRDSQVLPRWQVLGWLMQCARSAAGAAAVRLAVLQDMLYFTPAVDSVMSIEPACLVIVGSVPKYIHMTNALLDTMFRAMEPADGWPAVAAAERRAGVEGGAASARLSAKLKQLLQAVQAGGDGGGVWQPAAAVLQVLGACSGAVVSGGDAFSASVPSARHFHAAVTALVDMVLAGGASGAVLWLDADRTAPRNGAGNAAPNPRDSKESPTEPLLEGVSVARVLARAALAGCTVAEGAPKDRSLRLRQAGVWLLAALRCCVATSTIGVALLLEAGATALAASQPITSGAPTAMESGALARQLALWAEVAEEAAKLAAPQGLAERKALLPAGVALEQSAAEGAAAEGGAASEGTCLRELWGLDPESDSDLS
ncbi:hypothetical protein WJX81_004196 [Elliptochloris bilobata]|uniref:Integrator complex subunit 3 N-terminal domain-containing protein n=1 Tax=Elliptochloris bilobata TaxID=381761 RepID=A0AAW1S3Z1_9CHLO